VRPKPGQEDTILEDVIAWDGKSWEMA